MKRYVFDMNTNEKAENIRETSESLLAFYANEITDMSKASNKIYNILTETDQNNNEGSGEQ